MCAPRARSNPAAPRRALVAQGIEQRFPKPRVASSSLAEGILFSPLVCDSCDRWPTLLTPTIPKFTMVLAFSRVPIASPEWIEQAMRDEAAIWLLNLIMDTRVTRVQTRPCKPRISWEQLGWEVDEAHKTPG